MDYTYKKKENKDFEIEVNVTVPQVEFQTVKEKEYNKAAAKIKLPGFRPGKAPKSAVEPAIINDVIEETIRQIAPEVTSEILQKEEYTPFNQVDYDFSKVDLEKDFEFSFKCKVYPKFELPDLTKIKVEKKEVKASKKEVDEFIENYIKNVEQSKDEKDRKTIDTIDDKWVVEQKMPEVKDLKGMREFFEKVLKQQKQQASDEEYIKAALDAVVKASKFEVPEELVEQELKLKESTSKKRIEDLGLKWEDWLRQQDKKIEDLKKEWEEDIVNAIKLQLVISKASKDAKQKVSEDEIDAFINYYYDQKTRDKYGEERLRQDAEMNILQNKVINWIIAKIEGKDKDNKSK